MIAVGLIQAEQTSVSNTYNRVVVRFRLEQRVPQRALIKITHPEKFTRVTSGTERTNVCGSNFAPSPSIPRRTRICQKENIVELDSTDDSFPASSVAATEDLQLTITLSNPPISPSREENIWKFESFTVASTAPTDSSPAEEHLTLVDLNADVQGFAIYGAFRSTRVASRIDSPTVVNMAAISFVLESDLVYSESSVLKVYLPAGFRAYPMCGVEGFSRSYNPEWFLDAPAALDSGLAYQELPRGTSCEASAENDPEPHIALKPGAALQYGLDYACMFEIYNAPTVPVINTWRFQTMLDGVLLHLDRSVMGFGLSELQDIVVDPKDTSRSTLGQLIVKMRSTKRITGASDIRITAPVGFFPLNTLFNVLQFGSEGHTLASTTTCRID